jgi:predicted O-methyltransferase YrrM
MLRGITDGAKALYTDVLHLIEARLQPGSLVFADDAHRCLLFGCRMRSDAHHYLSVRLAGDLEISMRLL